MVRAARADELRSLADFIARLQGKPQSHIAYFGDTPDEIAAEIEEWGSSWANHCLVAERDGRVVGFMGADYDADLGRAWLHGPFAESAEWDALADRLLEQLIAEIVPGDVRDLVLAGDVANERLGQLAASHGFRRGTPSRALEIGRDMVSPFPQVGITPLEQQDHGEFVALHDALFPGTYYSGTQLVDQQAQGKAIVLVLVEPQGLVGYAAGRGDSGGEGYLDFVGVAEHARGAGRGQRLVLAACQALLDDPRRSKVALTVYEDNAPALALYARLGFTQVASLVGYRRRRPGKTEREP